MLNEEPKAAVLGTSEPTPEPKPPAPPDEPETLDYGPGVFPAMGAMPPATLINEEGLARLLGGVCRETIKRAVGRGELPRPVRLMGQPTWTVGAIVRHLEDRLAKESAKFSRLRA